MISNQDFQVLKEVTTGGKGGINIRKTATAWRYRVLVNAVDPAASVPHLQDENTAASHFSSDWRRWERPLREILDRAGDQNMCW